MNAPVLSPVCHATERAAAVVLRRPARCRVCRREIAVGSTVARLSGRGVECAPCAATGAWIHPMRRPA